MDINTWKASGLTFDYNGHAVFYHDEGSGDPLVLIHGFPTSSWDWCPIWAELSSRYRVIAADMMGFGCSPKPVTYPYSLFDQADLHEALLASLGLDRVKILSHDYGDTVAQELMARQQDGTHKLQLESVCMLNGGIIPGQHRPRLIQTLLISPIGPLVSRLMNEKKFHKSSRHLWTNTKPRQRAASLQSLLHGGAICTLIQYCASEETTAWLCLTSPVVRSSREITVSEPWDGCRDQAVILRDRFRKSRKVHIALGIKKAGSGQNRWLTTGTPNWNTRGTSGAS